MFGRSALGVRSFVAAGGREIVGQALDSVDGRVCHLALSDLGQGGERHTGFRGYPSLWDRGRFCLRRAG